MFLVCGKRGRGLKLPLRQPQAFQHSLLSATLSVNSLKPNATALLYWEKVGESELHLQKIIEFAGGCVEAHRLDSSFSASSLGPMLSGVRCCLVSAEALAGLGGGSTRLFGNMPDNVLVYGFQPCAEHAHVLRGISSGVVTGVTSVRPGVTKVEVTRDAVPFCQQLSGISLELPASSAPAAFVVASTTEGQKLNLMSVDGGSFFIRIESGERKLYLLAQSSFPDLDGRVARGTSSVSCLPAVAPILMFLQSSSPDGFWLSGAARACFIVDDPLLKRRYGFLDFEKLLEEMKQSRFCTSIAFIPWNYRRSSRQSARLFASEPGRFSLCVHGCDHTRGEFGSGDGGLLYHKCHQALERMKAHQEFCGVGFEDVMVFPQGIFSTVSLAALKRAGYLASVNSTPYPVDAENELCLRDLLEVAMTRFEGFPLFTRQYPTQFPELAFDLFLGKPALIVEHHQYFRGGYEPLSGLVEKLYGQDSRLEWGPVGANCSRASLRRIVEGEIVEVLFFTDRFVIKNAADSARNYRLIRHEPVGTPLGSATLNGRSVELSRCAEGTVAKVSLGPGEAGELVLTRGAAEPFPAQVRQGVFEKAKVHVRRTLSEFRDNYIDRSPVISRFARKRAARTLSPSRM